jgi:FkbM family methyltransferase
VQRWFLVIGTTSRRIDDGGRSSIERLMPLTPGSRQHSVDCLTNLYFELIDAFGIERHLEIGAKEASASQRALGCGTVREAIAFEANPGVHRRFGDSCSKLGVTYEHLAIGEADGTARLHVGRRKNGGLVSNGKASLVAYKRSRSRQVDVPMRSLDSYLTERSAPGSNAMWIDVEGAYAAVLRGASATLASTKVLIIELESAELYPGQEWLSLDACKYLRSVGLLPIARDVQSRQQFNVLFVRETLAGTSEFATARRGWKRALRAFPG